MHNSGSRTLLLVDDQLIFLESMDALLASTPDIKVIGKATSGKAAVSLARRHKPDLVLLDINMPHMDGIEVAKRLAQVSPRSRIVVLSMHGHKEFVRELLAHGVQGYLLKSTHKDELREALRTVANGGTYLAKEVEHLVQLGDRHKDRSGESKYGVLTSREVQVVKLIVQERTTQEIADKLFLSVDTVETHRRNIMHKIDARNLAGLIKYAMERGWNQ